MLGNGGAGIAQSTMARVVAAAMWGISVWARLAAKVPPPRSRASPTATVVMGKRRPALRYGGAGGAGGIGDLLHGLQVMLRSPRSRELNRPVAAGASRNHLALLVVCCHGSKTMIMVAFTQELRSGHPSTGTCK